MRMAAGVALSTLLAVASAWADFGPYGLEGNDRGGIIPWTPAVEPIYRQLAADHCARFSKGSQITTVRHKIGDYVAFDCRFDRGYDPVKAASGPPLIVIPPAPVAPFAPKRVLATPPSDK